MADDADIREAEQQLKAEMEQLTKRMARLRFLVVALLLAMLAFIGYVLYVVLSRPYDPLRDH